MKHWTDEAKCKGLDPNLFFPVGTGFNEKGVARSDRQSTDKLERETADFCHGRGSFPGKACVVKDDCLEFAIVNNEDGVFGGTTTVQRITIRKRQRQKIAM